MSNFSDDQINKIWNKGRSIPGKSPDEYRLDAAGALMKRSHRGKDDDYDWEIDHVLPRNMMKDLGIPEDEWDNSANLRPFNAKNNAKKSDNYPEYTRRLVYNRNTGKNEISEIGKVVNEVVQKGINDTYNLNWEIIEGAPSED